MRTGTCLYYVFDTLAIIFFTASTRNLLAGPNLGRTDIVQQGNTQRTRRTHASVPHSCCLSGHTCPGHHTTPTHTTCTPARLSLTRDPTTWSSRSKLEVMLLVLPCETRYLEARAYLSRWLPCFAFECDLVAIGVLWMSRVVSG